ncbi:hypothetical protein HMPREF9017_01586 [Parascardovia denticolens F0305]|nr:hypothetical protein HMPREF9017_01586 [Parascardovia denticolens F0305]
MSGLREARLAEGYSQGDLARMSGVDVNITARIVSPASAMTIIMLPSARGPPPYSPTPTPEGSPTPPSRSCPSWPPVASAATGSVVMSEKM